MYAERVNRYVGTHLFVKVPWPGDIEGTFLVFESSFNWVKNKSQLLVRYTHKLKTMSKSSSGLQPCLHSHKIASLQYWVLLWFNFMPKNVRQVLNIWPSFKVKK